MLEFLGNFRQPTYCLETVKTVRVDWLDCKLSMCVVCKILFRVNGFECVWK